MKEHFKEHWPLYVFYLLCVLFVWWLFQIDVPDKCPCHDGFYADEKDCAPDEAVDAARAAIAKAGGAA